MSEKLKLEGDLATSLLSQARQKGDASRVLLFDVRPLAKPAAKAPPAPPVGTAHDGTIY